MSGAPAARAPETRLAPARGWLAAFRSAIVQPRLPAYRRLAGEMAPRGLVVGGVLWLSASALASGLVLVVLPSGTRASPALDGALAGAIVVFACVALGAWTVFGAIVHAAARLFGGRGVYRVFVCLSSAIQAPLLLVATMLVLLPEHRLVPTVLYGYWLLLYVLAVRAVYGLPGRKALAAVCVPFVVGAALVGGGVLLLAAR